jgi:predicted O-methyltransferase YrrM
VTIVPQVWADEYRVCQVGPEAPVPILQWQWEFKTVLDLYGQRAPQKVVEIGTYHGGTLYHWLQRAAPGATVVSIDSYVAGVDNTGLYEGWCPEDVTLKVIKGNSNDVWVDHFDELSGCEWLFIDAGHYYEEVEADWRHYRPFVREGGVVLFHDIVPGGDQHPELQVHQLWREIQARGYVTQEIISDHVADWGGIGICYL